MQRAEALDAAISGDNTSCEVAQVDFWDARREFKRYKDLMFVVAATFVGFLIVGIVLVSIGSDTRGAGIVSFVATVASGGAMSWVRGRRNQASKDKDAAKRLVRKYCSTPESVVETLEGGAVPVLGLTDGVSIDAGSPATARREVDHV
jgi:hypothetical protein